MKKEVKILKEIKKLSDRIGRQINLMEVCGKHTQAISRYGIRGILPKNIKLTSGPGCPVCATAQEDIDAIVNIALAGVPVATYGDALRVPGWFGSLDQAREKGAKVFAIYSTEDALKLKEKYNNLVFFGLGFDTTTPMTAYAIKKGLTVYSTHKLFLPAMHALIDMGEIKIDGFIDPGHVSTIIGLKPYEELNVAQVITGFTDKDVLAGIYMLLKQIASGRKEVENQYLRSVRPDGNPRARQEIFSVFKIGDGNWRGFGIIPQSGLTIIDKYKNQDAKLKYKKILSQAKLSGIQKPTACVCGEIIRGLKESNNCPLFRKVCTPEKPIGPCMVSQEGACNVYYRYN